MLPLPPPPFDFYAGPPTIPQLQDWGARPVNPGPALTTYGVNPSLIPWFQNPNNVNYYDMSPVPPPRSPWEPYYDEDIPTPALYYNTNPAFVGLWSTSDDVITHETTHAYRDRYGDIWPWGQRPQGESQAMPLNGYLLGLVKRWMVDPQYQGRVDPASQWAKWFVSQGPSFPEHEIYATLAPFYKDLPPYIQNAYRGLFTTEAPEGPRRLN